MPKLAPITIPEDLQDRLQARSESTGVSIAEFVRRALDAALAEPAQERCQACDAPQPYISAGGVKLCGMCAAQGNVHQAIEIAKRKHGARLAAIAAELDVQ